MASATLSQRSVSSCARGLVDSQRGSSARIHAGPVLPLRRPACSQSFGRPGSFVLSDIQKQKTMKRQSVIRSAAHEVGVNPQELQGGSKRQGGTKTMERPESGDPGDVYFAKDKRPVILFDGVCNLCNTGVNFMLDHDPKGNLRFAALQSDAGRALLQRANRDPADITSIVLVKPDKCYIRSEAILNIAQYLHQPLIFLGKLGLFFPGFFRDKFYNLIAYNRYSIMGKRNMCRIGDTRFDDRFVA